MSNERTNLVVDSNKPQVSDKVIKIVSEIVLTEIQYAKDIHEFVSSMDQWLDENSTKIAEEDVITIKAELNLMRELYTIDEKTNEPRTLLLQNDDAFELAYNLETLRTKNKEKIITRNDNEKVIIKALSEKVVDENKIPNILNSLTDKNLFANLQEPVGNYVRTHITFTQFLGDMQKKYQKKYPDIFTINKNSQKINLLTLPREDGKAGEGLNLLKDYPIKIPQRSPRYDIFYKDLENNLDKTTNIYSAILGAQAAVKELSSSTNAVNQYDNLAYGQMAAFYSAAISDEKIQSNLPEVFFNLEMTSKFKNNMDKLTVESKKAIYERINKIEKGTMDSLTSSEQDYYVLIKNPALNTFKLDYENLIEAEQKRDNLLMARTYFEAFIEVSLSSGNEIASKKAIKSVLDNVNQEIKLAEENIKNVNKKIKHKQKELSKEQKLSLENARKELPKKAKKTNPVNQAKEIIMQERILMEQTAIDKIDLEIKAYQNRVEKISEKIDNTRKIGFSNFDFNTLQQAVIPSIPQFKQMIEKWAYLENKEKAESNYNSFLKNQPQIKDGFEKMKEGLSDVYVLQSKLNSLTAIENDLAQLENMKTNVTQYSNKKFTDLFTEDKKNQVKKMLSQFDKTDSIDIKKLRLEIEAEKKKLGKELEQTGKILGNLDQNLIAQRRQLISNMPYIPNSQQAAQLGQNSAKDKVNFFIENLKVELNEFVMKYESDVQTASSKDKRKSGMLDVFQATTTAKTILAYILDLERDKNMGAREKMDKLASIIWNPKLSDNYLHDIQKGFNTSYETIRQDFKQQLKEIKKERLEIKKIKTELPTDYAVLSIQKSIDSALDKYHAILENLKIKSDYISKQDKLDKNNARILKYNHVCKELEKLRNIRDPHQRHLLVDKIGILLNQEKALPISAAKFLSDLKNEIGKYAEKEKTDLEHKHKQGAGLFDPSLRKPERKSQEYPSKREKH